MLKDVCCCPVAVWSCRDKNAFKTINAAPGSAVAKAAAASLEGSNTADVFSRRHTVSKVYWATGRGKAAAAAEDGAAGQEQQRLRRSSSSGAAEVEGLKGSLKRMDPTELIKVRVGCVEAYGWCAASEVVKRVPLLSTAEVNSHRKAEAGSVLMVLCPPPPCRRRCWT